MPDLTARRLISQPKADRSDAADVPLYIRNVAAATDLDVIWKEGLAAARITPDIAGTVFRATDTGVISLCIGASWVTLVGGSILPTRISTRLRMSGPQSIPDAAFTVLNFDTEDWDYVTDPLHDTGVNISRITIPAALAGIWKLWANATFANPGENGRVDIRIRKNGVTIFAGQSSTSFTNGVHISVEDLAVAADYYEVQVLQSHAPSPGAVNTASPTYFGARLVSA